MASRHRQNNHSKIGNWSDLQADLNISERNNRLQTNISNMTMERKFDKFLNQMREEFRRMIQSEHKSFEDLQNQHTSHMENFIKNQLEVEFSHIEEFIDDRFSYNRQLLQTVDPVKTECNLVDTTFKDDKMSVEIATTIQPIEKKIEEMRKNLAELKKSLNAKKQVKQVKQDINFRVSNTLPFNIISRTHHIQLIEKISHKLTREEQNNLLMVGTLARLVRKNGTEHFVQGEINVPVNTPLGRRSVPFYVVNTLHGDAYMTKQTHTELFKNGY